MADKLRDYEFGGSARPMSYFKHILGVSVACLAIQAQAATVVVDGVGPDSNPTGPFKTLWAAVQYTNGAGVGPHVIDVTADSSVAADNNKTILITNEVTINGNADADSNPYDMLVDIATIRTAAVVGQGVRSFIKIECAGSVELNDIRIHPNARGNTTQVDGLGTYNPSSGTGTYTLNNVWISTSNSAATPTFVDPLTENDLYNLPAAATALLWYGYTATSGVFFIGDGSGAGTSNVTLNDCRGAGARSHVLNIVKTKGTTVVNKGVFAHAGEDCIRLAGSGITVAGTYTNRVKAFRSNRSSSGEGVRVVAGASVNLLEYIDSYLHTSGSSPIAVYGGTVTTMRYVRGYTSATQGGGAPLYFAGNGSGTVEKCTFFANRASGAIHPASFPSTHSGTVNFVDSIFASGAAGQLQLAGTAATYTISNCALPTDAYAAESLNATTPVSSTVVVTPSGSVTDSPHFQTLTHSVSNLQNVNWLRPTAGIPYTGTATGGTNLSGGAGGTAVPVGLSEFSIE